MESESESTHWLESSDSSLDETEIDMLDDIEKEKDIYRYSIHLIFILFFWFGLFDWIMVHRLCRFK